ncbi:MAG: PTS sugar transporter subunit IIA [Candidatus Cloacimonetes bacterium]|nr:PTS sugar transporter subunit IIA [Candidatus Cloacimonadota bacterium]MCF7813870.1 PTS sugar transporter subunit IIA [Candidatus Cloacimonadota bacterium]MCF7868919.1 PTS sugar transporter subunit IIA [Candidatus Cloacimonadota bacterium]MCF7883982.1 PTS sugar transporter subunit IIA [Candidatus Cloacimonadota bacterium]
MEKILKVSDMINENFILDIEGDTKKEALNELLDVICESPLITEPKIFRKAIFKREKLMSTGIGYEIAIPHARHKSIKDFVIALGRKKEGLEYASIDDKPVKLIFMIGASDKQDKDYIRLISRLVLRLKNKEFVNNLLKAKDAAEMYKIIHEQK